MLGGRGVRLLDRCVTGLCLDSQERPPILNIFNTGAALHVLVDGNRAPGCAKPCTAIIGGDGISLSVGAIWIAANGAGRVDDAAARAIHMTGRIPIRATRAARIAARLGSTARCRITGWHLESSPGYPE
jgi:hypothetical protein